MKKMKTTKTITIFCGSKTGNNPIYKKEAAKIASLLSYNGYPVIYGGGKIGLMGIIYKFIGKFNGKVIGIIPEFLNTSKIRQNNNKNLVVVKSLHKRKLLMIKKADIFLILPGGFGTLDELFEILTLNQLNIYNKPVFIFNISNYWKNLKLLLKNMNKEGFLDIDDIKNILWVDDSEELLKEIKKVN